MTRTHRIVFACLTLAPLSLTLPGCVVRDIRDGIEQANVNLTTINDSFAKVEKANELLDRVDQDLDKLEAIQARLNSIDTNLTTMDERLATLQVSLDKVEVSLASLRKTINNIDSTIPFLKISGDSDDEKEELEGEDAVEEGAEQPVTPPAEGAGGGESGGA